MRILFVASNIVCPGGNGGSTHVTEVVTRLRAHDEVLLIAHAQSTLPHTLAIGPSTPPVGLRRLAARRLERLSWAQVAEFKPDVVYDRASSFGLGARLGRRLDLPVVCMVLDGQWAGDALATAARIITTRPGIIPRRYTAKVVAVHWGANTTLFHPGRDGRSTRDRLQIPSGRIVVCYAGGFYRWHGLEELVDAAARLRHLPLTFVLVGDGDRRAAIRRRVQDAGLSDAFIFTGKVPYADVADYVAAADICAAPYQPDRRGEFVYEPLKVFEYLAAGKATITLRSASLGALFADDRDLLLVPGRSVSALAVALTRLAGDRALRARLGAAGRDTVVARYSWDAHVDQLRRLFGELAGRPRAVERAGV